MSAFLKTFGYGLVVQFIHRCLLLLLLMMFVAQIAKVSCFMAKVTFCIACWASFTSIVKVTSTSWALVLLFSVGIRIGLRQKTLLAFGLALISLTTFLLRLLLSFLKIVNTLDGSDLFDVQFQTCKMFAYSESLLESECDWYLK